MSNKETVDPRALLEGTTPGPWEVVRSDGEVGVMSDPKSGVWVATTGLSHHDEPEAHARLIAAAPQLALTCISQEERIAALWEALDRLFIQALQSDVNEPSNAMGCDALAQARTALTNTGDA